MKNLYYFFITNKMSFSKWQQRLINKLKKAFKATNKIDDNYEKEFIKNYYCMEANMENS